MYKKYEQLLRENNTNTSRVAKATGIDKSFFSKWKAGKFQPKYDKVMKIAEHFNVPVSYFYGDEPDLPLEEHKKSVEQMSTEDLLDFIYDSILINVETSKSEKERYIKRMKHYSDFLISEIKNGNKHND